MFIQIAPCSIVLSWFTGVYVDLKILGFLRGVCSRRGGNWGSTPHPVTVANEVYRDSLPKMVHNPRGDWNPGWGVDLRFHPKKPQIFGGRGQKYEESHPGLEKKYRRIALELFGMIVPRGFRFVPYTFSETIRHRWYLGI